MNKHLQQFISNNKAVIYLSVSTTALLSGGFIYIILRPTKLDIFHLFNFPETENPILSIIQNSFLLKNTLPEWVVFSLPDGLWAFAYSIFITGMWWTGKPSLKNLWMASIPVLVIGFEILQYTGLLQGTFCIQDLIAGIIGSIIGIFTGIKLSKWKYYEKENV